jgi:hypothetical protein
VTRASSLVLFAAAVLSGQIPNPRTAPPAQPLPFSHKTHTAEAKLKCEDCHTAPAKFGEEVGMPATGKCMACHVIVAKDKPAIQELAGFAAEKKPIRWARVFQLKDFVFFDHLFHQMNGAKCADCHGPVAEREVTADELAATTMAFCQSCHSRTHAALGCRTCHELN